MIIYIVMENWSDSKRGWVNSVTKSKKKAEELVKTLIEFNTPKLEEGEQYNAWIEIRTLTE